MTSFCKNYQARGLKRVAWARDGKNGLFTRLRCKQWSCEFCAKKNQKIWREWLIKRLPEISDTWWLVTFTANENTINTADSIQNLRVHLDALFKRMRRVWPQFQYVRIYEKHPTSKRIHAHLIACGISPFVSREKDKRGKIITKPLYVREGRVGTWAINTWLKKTARDLHMGYMASAVPPKGKTAKDVVFYVTKHVTEYCTKSSQDFHIKGLRHVQVSQKIGSPPENSSERTWQVGYSLRAWNFPPGTKITDCQTKFVISAEYWAIRDFYPLDE